MATRAISAPEAISLNQSPFPHVPPAKTAKEVMAGAGAQRPDTVDSYYRNTATTFAQVQERTFRH